MEEIYRDIPGYEGMYQCSNLGNVKNIRSGKILKYQTMPNGYNRLCLHKNGKQTGFYIHRLVAEAFLPNPDKLPQVNHKSEKKTQNFVYVNDDGTVDLEKSNLEWCTAKYNLNYGSRIEKFRKSMLNDNYKDEYFNHHDWYEKNKLKILKQSKEYYEKNKEAKSAKHKEYYEKNKEAKLAKNKEYYQKDIDTNRAKHRNYYYKNRDAILAKQRESYRKKKAG